MLLKWFFLNSDTTSQIIEKLHAAYNFYDISPRAAIENKAKNAEIYYQPHQNLFPKKTRIVMCLSKFSPWT